MRNGSQAMFCRLGVAYSRTAGEKSAYDLIYPIMTGYYYNYRKYYIDDQLYGSRLVAF